MPQPPHQTGRTVRSSSPPIRSAGLASRSDYSTSPELLSALAAYPQATGATDVAITMTVVGKRVEPDFDLSLPKSSSVLVRLLFDTR